jgi:hypothetical protein
MAAEHLLREFENSVLRRKFGPKRDETIGSSRKLHDEKFHTLHSSSNIIRTITLRRIRWAANLARLVGNMNTVILAGKPKGNRSLRRSRRRWEDNIRINHTAIA